MEVIPTVSGETSFGGQAYPKITPLPSMILTRWWKVISHRPYLLNPLQPNISIHVPHTVLYTFPEVLTERICLPIKRFLPWWPFSLFSWPYMYHFGLRIWVQKQNPHIETKLEDTRTPLGQLSSISHRLGVQFLHVWENTFSVQFEKEIAGRLVWTQLYRWLS